MRQQQQFVTQQKEIARLEEAIRRFKDLAHRTEDKRYIIRARNKQRQIERMDKVDRPVFERRKMAPGAARAGCAAASASSSCATSSSIRC